MIVRNIAALLVFICSVACAPVGSGLLIEGNTLVCDHPKLSMRFKKKIADIQESGSNRAITFFGGDPRPMTIEFIRIPHSTKIDYFYSLPHIASSMNHYYLETVQFGGKEWAKSASYVAGSETLYCGYFTRKHNEFIFISIRNKNVPQEGAKAFAEYAKTLKMSEQALAIINEQFDYFDQVADIL